MAVVKSSPSVARVPLSEIKYREDLYPRIETSAVTVQKYAETLGVLPPIEVNQHNELIDGWHRWTAHKKQKAETIAVVVTQTESDAHLLELAIERNATHGLQLSQEDKERMAKRIYETCVYSNQTEREEKKAYLAKILSVSDRTIRDWLSRMDKDAKADLRRLAFDMWLACYTHEEIAEKVGYKRRTVSDFLETVAFGGNGDSAISAQTLDPDSDSDDDEETGNTLGRWKATKANAPLAEHAVDFDVPLYNVWKFKEKTKGSKHFGNTESTIVDNLLYLYTQPFDIVVDPFAGGGSTIDVCKKRFRRYYVSDRKPVVEREHEIRQADITESLPGPSRWEDVKLVYLDPPYWKQAEGQYSDDPSDLANMDLDAFTKALASLVKSYAKKLKPGARIALIIQPTQWKAPERAYTDHVADLLREVKLPVDMRIQCPYESQQCNAQMVEWAKENRKLLVLSRELVVWRVE